VPGRHWPRCRPSCVPGSGPETPPRYLDAKAAQGALAKLLDVLPDAERAALIKGSSGQPMTSDEACAAFRSVASGVKTLPADARDAVIWGLMNPDAI